MDELFRTPDISHLNSTDYDQVYEPAEDTFLFLDALEKEHVFLKRLRPTLCFEVGSGSGVVSTFLARILCGSCINICTDINPRAAAVTSRTAQQNHQVLCPVITDLASSLLPRIRHQVDLLLFNPPYVVTPSEEVGSTGIEASWAGGRDGREVLDRLLPQVPEMLSPEGVFYLVVIKENKPDDISDLLGSHGFNSEVVLSRRSGPEHLSIMKFTRNR